MKRLLDGMNEEQKTSNTLWRGRYGQPLNPQQMRDMLRARIRKAGGVTLEDVNKLTDHAYGSHMFDDFYNKPDSPKAIQDFIGKKNLSHLQLPLVVQTEKECQSQTYVGIFWL
ncbi:MAG: hypothetical protein EZS28_048101, partial [Streblomastix strix]